MLLKSKRPVILQLKIISCPVIFSLQKVLCHVILLMKKVSAPWFTVLKKVTAPVPECPAPVSINFAPSLSTSSANFYSNSSNHCSLFQVSLANSNTPATQSDNKNPVNIPKRLLSAHLDEHVLCYYNQVFFGWPTSLWGALLCPP